MQIVSHPLFAENYRPSAGVDSHPLVQAEAVQVLISRNLDCDVAEWRDKEFELVGHAEFAAKGNRGVGVEARAQAAKVGATLVLFSLWPAKLKAIKHLPDGTIDMSAVLSDPPATLSPKGYYVMKAVFMRPNTAFQRTASGGR